jgi:hypothetical protein
MRVPAGLGLLCAELLLAGCGGSAPRALASSTAAVPSSPGPERVVEGNAIRSARDPAARIVLKPPVTFVGADRWRLYDVADCELLAFVDADPARKVRRLLWVQFEAYLSERPDLHYAYDSPRRVTVGGMPFIVDTGLRSTDAPTRPGSDWEHMKAMVTARGYALPAGMMTTRLVHLLTAENRSELMIIYGEDVAPTGHDVAALSEGGAARGEWPQIEAALVERAREAVQIE